MTARLVYLVKPHSRLKKAHELQIEYAEGAKKTFVGTQLKKSLREVDHLLESQKAKDSES